MIIIVLTKLGNHSFLSWNYECYNIVTYIILLFITVVIHIFSTKANQNYIWIKWINDLDDA